MFASPNVIVFAATASYPQMRTRQLSGNTTLLHLPRRYALRRRNCLTASELPSATLSNAASTSRNAISSLYPRPYASSQNSAASLVVTSAYSVRPLQRLLSHTNTAWHNYLSRTVSASCISSYASLPTSTQFRYTIRFSIRSERVVNRPSFRPS